VTRRLQMNESIQLTIDSLGAYGPLYKHWGVAWSGGKDSSALLTLVVWLIESGKVPAPETLTVCYADTRMELLPLWLAAQELREELEERGINVRVVTAALDKRFMVYMLGRGVPPPNNRTLRWCTRQIKIDPMRAELQRLHSARTGKILMLTGVRQGESAIRDGRIAMSCSKDGAECGQGWYQQTLPGALCDTLAPLLHWRVCHVWEWLKHWAPQAQFGDWSTALLADAYGGDEAEEGHARTGCVGCPLATKDAALDVLLKNPRWAYLAPLKGLRPVYRRLREPEMRLRKAAGERRADGRLASNQGRIGPLTLAARRWALGEILYLQASVNEEAARLGRPRIDLLNAGEVARIEALIEAETWPERWTGEEARADEAAPVARAMRAITVDAGWAQAVARLGCDVVSRPWKRVPVARVGEVIALHAGGRLGDGISDAARRAGWSVHGVVYRRGGERVHLALDESPRSAVVALARVAAVSRESGSPWAEPGCVHLELADVRVLPEPTACPGRPGWWLLPPEITERLPPVSRS